MTQCFLIKVSSRPFLGFIVRPVLKVGTFLDFLDKAEATVVPGLQCTWRDLLCLLL